MRKINIRRTVMDDGTRCNDTFISPQATSALSRYGNLTLYGIRIFKLCTPEV